MVLSIDDSKVGNDARTKILQGAGLKVMQVYSGSEAIRNLQTEARIDVVLLDYYLGDSTGDDMLIYIRSLHPEAKVVLISGETTNLEGFDCILSKPVDPAQLIRTVLELIDKAAA